MKRVIVGLAILTMVWCGMAQADVMFELGNHPQSNEENILFNTLGASGSTISGLTNTSNTIVNFSSNTDTLMASGGQSDIDAQDDLINNITITLTGGATFLDFILNPFKGSGDVTLTAVTNDGTFTFTYTLGNGQNFVTVTTSPGETLSSLTINSTNGFDDLKQPRISGAGGESVGAVPEPATMLLLGSGFLGLWGLRKKFKS